MYVQNEEILRIENVQLLARFHKSRTQFIYRNTGFRYETETTDVDKSELFQRRWYNVVATFTW